MKLLFQNADIITEQELAEFLAALMGNRGGVVSGLELSDGGGLNVDVAAGKAIVNGYFCEVDAATLLAPDNDSRRIFLKVTKSGSLATSVAPILSSSQSPPDDDHIWLGRVVTASGAISRITPEHGFVTGVRTGTYTGTGSGSLNFALARTPRLVIVSKKGASYLIGVSHIGNPGTRSIPGIDSIFPRFYVTEGSSTPALELLSSIGATWSAGTVANGGSLSEDFTVSGAVADELAHVRFPLVDATAGARYSAQVVSADTVRVTVYNDSGSGLALNGQSLDLWVVHSGATTPGGAVTFVSGGTASQSPLIIEKGFTVSVSVAQPNLNESGVTYEWIAIF